MFKQTICVVVGTLIAGCGQTDSSKDVKLYPFECVSGTSTSKNRGDISAGYQQSYHPILKGGEFTISAGAQNFYEIKVEAPSTIHIYAGYANTYTILGEMDVLSKSKVLFGSCGVGNMYFSSSPMFMKKGEQA